MVAPKSPDWIPAGWIEQIKVTDTKKVKYYFNSETGQKFNTKKDLLQYVERGNLCRDESQQTSKLNESITEVTVEQNKGSPDRKDERNSESEPNERGSEPMPVEKERSEPKLEQNERSSEPDPSSVKTDGTPEWLPQGWTMEVKVKSSTKQKYKIFVEELTGRKFYSKPTVLEYLKTEKLDTSSQRKKTGNGSVSNADMGELAEPEGETSSKVEGSENINASEGTSRASKRKRKVSATKLAKKADMGELAEPEGETSSKVERSDNMNASEGTSNASKLKRKVSATKLAKNVVIERVAVEGLPSGWIKELKIETKSHGIRKDPFYTDPASGYVFRSQKDALRYIETGDPNVCAIKPKKREELSFFN